jgi:hypothetical protein
LLKPISKMNKARVKLHFIFFISVSFKVAGNVLQARVGGLSKHQLTLPTKGNLKILTLLVSRKQIVCRFNCARTMTDSARLLLLAVSGSCFCLFEVAAMFVKSDSGVYVSRLACFNVSISSE